MSSRYDYLIVGAGIYGATAARLLADEGFSVLVVERRKNIAGNCYTEAVDGIMVHRYGAHIFHTNDDEVWEFVNRFADFNGYVHKVEAEYKGERYSLPFNMKTFEQMWGVTDAESAKSIIEAQRREAGIEEPSNLEEQAISMVGSDIYEKLVKGYTEKQWGRACRELPAFIIRRLPLRFEYNDEYFDAKHQGIPRGGYTEMIGRMLEGIEVRLGVDFVEHHKELEAIADRIIYTGTVDELCGYKYGELEYRTLRFEEERLEQDDYQGRAVVNFTDAEVPWNRIIEHKWLEMDCDKSHTIITKEYGKCWTLGDEPFYPINDSKNEALYERYAEDIRSNPKYILGGRLGDYKYYDMDVAVREAMSMVESLV